MVDRWAVHPVRRLKILASASLAGLICLTAGSGMGLANTSSRPQPAQPALAVTRVSGAITSNTTWKRAGSPYQVTGQIAVVAAATLTIEPGVEVRFGDDAQLSVDGGLIAEGTAEQGIRFVGVTERSGSWRGISLQGSPVGPATGSFAHVTIAGGGGAGEFRGQLYVYSAVVEIRDSEIRDGAGDGIVVDSGSLTLVDTRITGNASLPLHVRSLTGLGTIAAVDPVLRDLTIQGNGVDAIAIDGGNLSLDSTWENAGAPYLVSGQVFVHAPATLTIEPGVQVQFEAAGELDIEGAIDAIGTEALPIRLVGATDTAGAWRGIRLVGRGTEPARATMAHVTVANAGNGGISAIDVFNGRLSFTDGQIVNHAADGVLFSGGTVSGLVEGSAITGIGGVGLRNTTGQLIIAPNNWWGSPTGPTTNDACDAGNGTRLEGLVRFGPWLSSAEQRPDPLAPLEIPLITLSPQRWYAPADGQTRLWVDISLLDPRGHPIPGATVILVSSLGDVTSGGITDAVGHTLAYLTSTEVGDAELFATLSTVDRCDQASSTMALVTFTDEADGLLAGMQAPYLYTGIRVAPMPVTRGVPTTITARLTNPNDAPIKVEATFEFVQSGIGLAFGPVGPPQVKEIPAGGEQVFETTWTPSVSGHYCVQVLYHVVDGELPTPTLGAVAAANGGAFPVPVGSFGDFGGGGGGQLNLNVYGGGLGGGGGAPGKPGGKPPLEKAKNASDAVGKMGKFAGGATFIPRAAVGALTGWQFQKAAQISQGLGFDPPRQDYKIIAEPVRPPLPAVTRPAGMSDERFAAEVKLAEAMAELTAVGDAAIISFDRYGGASNANDLEWASVQAASLLHYRKLYGTAAIVAADGMSALRTVMEREGGAETGLTLQQATDGLAEISASGFSREQVDAAHALGLTDEAIEAVRQELLGTAPSDLAGSFVVRLAEAELAFREMGDYLVQPVNFSNESPVAGADGGLVAVAMAADDDSNLARIYDHTSTIQVGNPLDHTATVDLRVRLLSMPLEWPVDLSPASIVLGPGEIATVTVTISATTPWPQGSRSDVAIEGFSEGQLLGGVVVALLVPRSVPFGVVPDAGPPLLVIVIAAVATTLVLVVVLALFLRRRRGRPAAVSRPS